jgi:hypothetical protein
MKKNLIPIILLLIIISLFIGSVSAANNNNGVLIQKTGQKNLLDSGANKFYWGERGGIFSYTWKTYKNSKSVIINVHYKTINNSWYGTYTITKVSKDRLKIVEKSPEVKLYSGHSSVTSYATTSLTPVQYYSNTLKSQIENDGYLMD